MSNVVLTAVPGNQKISVSWTLSGDASAATRGELIVNDVIMNQNVPTNGFKSIPINDTDWGARKTFFNGENGIEYSVMLLVYVNQTVYKSELLKKRPQSVSVNPIIECEGTTSAVRIQIKNYSSVEDQSNGFSINTDYEVFYNSDTRKFPAASELMLDGLENGRQYEIGVRAINGNGVSDFSLTKVVTPSSKPLNVTDFGASVKDHGVMLNWVPPVNMLADSTYIISKKVANGEYEDLSPLSKTIQVAPVAPSTTTTTANRVSYEYTGLDNGVRHSFRIRVYNSASGYSGYLYQLDKVPYGLPDVPGFSFTVENQKINIRLSRPVSTNGESLKKYILKRINSNGVEGSALIPSVAMDLSFNEYHVISNLENGTQYSFNAYALNNIDPNSSSVAQLISATPYGAPGAVTSLTAVGGDLEVRLSWVAPTNTGGADVLSYRVSYSYESTAAVGTLGSVGYIPPVYTNVAVTTNDLFSVLTTGLVNGRSTDFKVVAYFTRTIEYTSAEEPKACTPFRAPDAPVVSAVMSGDNISYSWLEPELYGLPFQSYRYKTMLTNQLYPDLVPWVTPDLSANTLVVAPKSSPSDYGKSHKLLIYTITKNGTLPPVESTVTEKLYTPYIAPSVVRRLAVYPKKDALLVTWDPPANFGGYTSIKYKVCVDNDMSEPEIDAEKIVIDGLTEPRAYSITVYAIGCIDGALKQNSPVQSGAGTPYTQPPTPANFSATPQVSNASVILTWDAVSVSDQNTTKYVIFRNDDHVTETDLLTYTYVGTEGVSSVYKVMTKQLWAAGYTTYSEFTPEITATPYGNPETVSQLTLSAVSNAMTISWLPLSVSQKHGLTGTVFYDVVVSYMENGQKMPLPTVPVSGTTTLYVENLVNDRDYTVEVKTRIFNTELERDILSTGVASKTIRVNPKPAGPLNGSVSFIPSNGNIRVEWFSPANDSYEFVRYEIFVNNDPPIPSSSNVRSGTKNFLNIPLTNGTSNVVKICRVGTLNGVESSSDFVTSQSLMPFGKPLLSAPVISGKDINFSINPNGSGLIQILVFATTDKYTAGDEAYKLVSYTSEPSTGTVAKTITLNIANGTVIQGVFYAVINAAGATTPV